MMSATPITLCVRTTTGQSQQQSMPFNMKDDKSLIVLVSTANGKDITSIAETLCGLARVRGVTEARMVDHTLEPLFKVGM